eukprot:2154946-Pleurochrysis_carterae.AAC.1
MRMNVPCATAVYNETDKALSVAQVTASTGRVSADTRRGHRARACGEGRRCSTAGNRQVRRGLGVNWRG